ncbi:hypothetical protein [Sphingorhabdus wooponensis]|uniref:Uncharacterized protein n=1 Tax=Sphingorhabdus wooponensis TaxID=940136 RepID=A0A426RTN8_9SPHN|nr:hypothetical protein [Sphingorhabdus wooponensis]RRQ52286.1 hypothetical protein D7D48_05325 [Sphingorhabdus wooponensis]
MRFAKVATLIAILALWTPPVKADLADDLSSYVGYTIVAVKTISKSIDDDGEETSFRGCRFGRVIVFDDGKYVTCSSYGYQYALRPRALILSNGSSSMVMIVGDKVHQVR